MPARAANDMNSSPQILVTCAHGVHDVTRFVTVNPGGDQILLSIGDALESSCSLFLLHSSEFVLETLSELRIANLTPNNQWRCTPISKAASDDDAPTSPYAANPPAQPPAHRAIDGTFPCEGTTVSATVQCTGNRCNDLNIVCNVKEVVWETGTISNAVWGGACLEDMLAYLVGFTDVTGGAHSAHVCFKGMDANHVSRRVYAGSVPLDVPRLHRGGMLAY